MKAAEKTLGWLMPFALALSGCFNKTQQAQTQPLAPPIVNTPPPSSTPAQADVPPQVVTVPQTQQPQPEPQPTPPQKEEVKPVKRPARHPKPDTSKTTEQAANTQSAGSGVSAIGQLTSGNSGDQRYQTEQSIASTDQGLKRITRSLNDQEQKTAAQIREFLKQARTALNAGDVDGAHTLAVKASVLLGELNK